MTRNHLDAFLRVAYHRDAMVYPSLEVQTLNLGDALQVAIEKHVPGEYPVIIGPKLQLIGIEAIRAARDTLQKKTS